LVILGKLKMTKVRLLEIWRVVASLLVCFLVLLSDELLDISLNPVLIGIDLGLIENKIGGKI
jgi:hypothetical protein